MGTVLLFGLLTGVLGALVAWIFTIQTRAADRSANADAASPRVLPTHQPSSARAPSASGNARVESSPAAEPAAKVIANQETTAAKTPKKPKQGVVAPSSARQFQLVEEQNTIAKEQNKLLAAQFRPLFRFVPGPRAVGNETFDALEIWNDGAPITLNHIRQASYIEVTRFGGGEHSVRFIPFYYFDRRDYNGDAKTGRLVTLHAWRDPHGGQPGTNITKEVNRLISEVNRGGINVVVSKRVFLTLMYRDRTGGGHLTTYEIYPMLVDSPPVPRLRTLHGQEDLTVNNLGMVAPADIKDLNAQNLLERSMAWGTLENIGDGLADYQ